MFGLSGEHLLIFGVVLLFFGPRTLPRFGTFMGRTVRNFRDSFSGVQEPEFRRVEERHDK